MTINPLHAPSHSMPPPWLHYVAALVLMLFLGYLLGREP